MRHRWSLRVLLAAAAMLYAFGALDWLGVLLVAIVMFAYLTTEDDS